jgi:SRSO17 transposase
VGPHWHRALMRWLRPYLAALPREPLRHWAPAYVAGLLGPSARKSIEPMAVLVADGDYDQLHHFLTTRAWDAAPLQQGLIRQATRQLGGPDACLIIDDTTLLKRGTHSVGAASSIRAPSVS